MNSISRYVGSGQRSSATIVSSLSAACGALSSAGKTSLAHVLGVGVGVAVGVVACGLLELADAALELVDRADQRAEGLEARGLCGAGGLGGGDALADFLLIPQRRRQDHRLGDHQRRVGLDVQRLHVRLGEDVEAALEFLRRVDLVLA